MSANDHPSETASVASDFTLLEGLFQLTVTGHTEDWEFEPRRKARSGPRPPAYLLFSTMIALALVAAITGTHAALDGLHPALGGVQIHLLGSGAG